MVNRRKKSSWSLLHGEGNIDNTNTSDYISVEGLFSNEKLKSLCVLSKAVDVDSKIILRNPKLRFFLSFFFLVTIVVLSNKVLLSNENFGATELMYRYRW